MSSGSPSIHAAKPGDASRLLSAIASAKRSFAGKNVSRSITPTWSNGGVWICWISAAEVEAPSRRARRARGCSRRACARGCGADRRRCRASASRPDAAAVDALAQRIGVVANRGRRRARTTAAPRAAARRCCPACRSRRSAASRNRAIRAPSSPHSASPSFQRFAGRGGEGVGATARPRRLVGVDPRPEVRRPQLRERRAAGCRGRPSDRWRSPGCRRSRPLRCSAMHRPVLPLPVMPTQTACVVRSFES